MTEFSSSLSSLVFGRTRAGGSFLFQESLNRLAYVIGRKIVGHGFGQHSASIRNLYVNNGEED